MVATSIEAHVEPAVLAWARQTSGLDPVGAARKIKVPDGRIEDWESGTVPPTIAQLRHAARVYNRSLAVFFLAEPPEDFDTMRDFRRLDGATSAEWSPALHREYRRSLAQRDQVLDLLDIEGDEPAMGWAAPNARADTDRLADQIRSVLLASAPLEAPRSSDKYVHLNFWSSALEASGVLVMTSARGDISKKEMRAFSVHFDVLPIIMLNGSDSARGRVFSLLHEYAHLTIRAAGLCDVTTDAVLSTPDRRLEAQCNAVSAAVLMPAERVRVHPGVTRHQPGHRWTFDELRDIAGTFGVSAEAMLRRLVTLGWSTSEYYEEKRPEYLQAYDDEELRSKSKDGKNKSHYQTAVRNLGKGYVRMVTDAHRRRVIDSFTAAEFLNAKVGQLDRLAKAASIRESP